MKDLIIYIVFKVVVFFLKFLPLRIWLFLARCFGWFYYYVSCLPIGSPSRQTKKAYLNLKIAFGTKSHRELMAVVKCMYQQFAQNFIETLYIPYMDENYIKKYVKFNGVSAVEEALKEGCGLIFLGIHAGSWELSNIACAKLFSKKFSNGAKYAMLAQPQARFKKLDGFLNALRESKGCGVIKANELKKMVEHLSGNNMLGIVADHGGKDGLPVEFFGKLAMTPVGSIKLSKKLGSKIILAFMHRINGEVNEILFKPYNLVSVNDMAQDLKINLESINRIFENWITQYPYEYLWYFKRWKYSPQKSVLILSDCKAGHFRQSLAVSEMIKELNPQASLQARVEVVEVRYKTARLARFLSFVGFVFGCKFASLFLKFALRQETVEGLTRSSCDLVISTGSSLAVLNRIVALENNAKSIAIMRPGIFNMNDFSLVIMPQHDNPPKIKNVLKITGSLNNMTSGVMEGEFQNLCSVLPSLRGIEVLNCPKIGLFIGGNSKNYALAPETVDFLCIQLKKVAQDLDGYLFVTTSRRTPEVVVNILKEHFKDSARCKLFINAADNNPPGAVGGILYLSDIVVVSGESISMVSEAVSSSKFVIVFEPRRKKEDNKIRKFLSSLKDEKYIYLLKLNEIYDKLIWIARNRPERPLLDTKGRILEELRKII